VPAGEVDSQSQAPSGIVLDETNDIATCYKTAAGATALGTLALQVDGTNLGGTSADSIREIQFEFSLSDPPLIGMGLKIEGGDEVNSELLVHHWWHTGTWHITNGSVTTRWTSYQYKHQAEPGIYQLRIKFGELSNRYSLWLFNTQGVPFKVTGDVSFPSGWKGNNLTFTIGNLWTQDDAGYFGSGLASDAAGESIIRAFRIYYYQATIPADFDVSTSPATALAKYNSLLAGTNTTDIAAAVADLTSRVTAAEKAASLADTFTVQLWDGLSLTGLPGYDPGYESGKWVDVAARFNVVQQLYLEGDGGTVDSNEIVPASDFTNNNLVLSNRGLYDWNSYIRTALDTHEGAYEVPPSPGDSTTQYEPLHADFLERAVILGLHQFYAYSHYYSALVPRFNMDTEQYSYIPGTVIKVDATSGNYTLTYSGQTTANIAYDATASDVKTALAALSNLTAADLVTWGNRTESIHVYSKSHFTTGDEFSLTAADVDLAGGASTVTVFPNLIVQAIAEDQGLSEFHIQWPTGDETFPLALADDDTRWLSLDWMYSRATLNVYHDLLATAITSIWPDVEFTTDPTRDHFRTERWNAFNVFTHWRTIGWAEADPTDIAYDVERGRVHQRSSTSNVARIVVGPQSYGENFVTGALTPELFATGCWMAVAWGVDGITNFGLSFMADLSAQTWQTNGEEVWDMMSTLKTSVYDTHATLLTDWSPKTRRVAMLCSFADYVTGEAEARTADYVNTISNRGLLLHQVESVRYAYAALMYAGEPADVVYDEEVLADKLTDDGYSTLLVPSLFCANQGLIDKIKAFATAGGTVICHDGSILETQSVTGLQVLDSTYWTDASNNPQTSLHPGTTKYEIDNEDGMTADDRKVFILAVATDLLAKFPSTLTPRVVYNTRGVAVSNVMLGSDGTEYLAIVNTDREPGSISEALGANYILDQCNATSVDIEYDNEACTGLKDEANGVVVPATTGGTHTIALDAGLGRILKVETQVGLESGITTIMEALSGVVTVREAFGRDAVVSVREALRGVVSVVA
tara:strand:+ start:4669 stop:7770 length:3102 start_codon:yes stop_codon:yes gene_type:complete